MENIKQENQEKNYGKLFFKKRYKYRKRSSHYNNDAAPLFFKCESL